GQVPGLVVERASANAPNSQGVLRKVHARLAACVATVIAVLAGGSADAAFQGINGAISGGAGNDKIDGGAGRNTISGGAGNDTIEVTNWARDTVNCGKGRDKVRADRSDKLRACERVK